MTDNVDEEGYKYIDLDIRMYEYIRATAITNITDALLELITNSIDAYSDVSDPEYPQTVEINLYNEDNKIIVIDNACGLDGTRLEKCFLTVGSYTSDSNKRGHFSRGAKDISSIANITFSTIKDDLFSQCILKDTAKGKVTNINIPATTELREQYNLAGNGLHVELELTKVTLKEWNRNNIKNNSALFDIFDNKKYDIMLINKDELTAEKLVYIHPEGKKILDIEYNLSRWHTKARFTLYTSNKLPRNQNGFIVSSDNAIYQFNLLSPYIWRNPLSSKLFGRLHCDGINKIIKDYDTTGPIKKNPFPLIEPSRMGGLGSKHPFTKELIAVPLRKIQYYFEECNYLKKQHKIQSISDLFYGLESLQDLGLSMLDDIVDEDDYDGKFNEDEGENSVIIPAELITLENSLNRSRPKQARIRDLDDTLELSENNVNTRINDMKGEFDDTSGKKVHVKMIDTENKYHINYDSKGIYLDISKTHPAMQEYLVNKTEDEISDALQTKEVRMLFADIFAEAFSDMLHAENIKKEDINLGDYTTDQLLLMLNQKYWEQYNKIEPKIYDMIVKGESVIDI